MEKKIVKMDQTRLQIVLRVCVAQVYSNVQMEIVLLA